MPLVKKLFLIIIFTSKRLLKKLGKFIRKNLLINFTINFTVEEFLNLKNNDSKK